MIISGREIERMQGSELLIVPFDEKRINPNSYNLRLSDELIVYDSEILDMKKDNDYTIIKIPKDGLVMEAGKLYLGRTMEYTETNSLVPMIEGRCFAKGTKILMWDKQFKEIQEIKIGDMVFGVDGKPKKVKSVHKGTNQLYNVHQSNGIDYVVNGNHLLHLYCNFTTCSSFEKGRTYDISVLDYMNLSNYNKEHLKGFRLPVEYYEDEKDFKVDPYLLGVWLGDGDNRGSRFTINNESLEIFKYIKTKYPNCNFKNYKEKATTVTLTKRGGHYVREDRNFDNGLRYYDLLHNKHIPEQYKKSSMETRLNVLAGILDTDGSPNNTCWEVTTVYPKLALDIMEVAESCGFTCSWNPIDRTDLGWSVAYRINIKGNVKNIPNKVSRKTNKINYEKLQDKTMSKITIDKREIGEYFGFELEGEEQDKLFYLEDFTIAHNSSVGRLGVFVHVTAGFGDVGFKGFWTLELTCIQPVRIYGGVEIAQIFYHKIDGDYDKYEKGKYQNNDGVQTSRLYLDFKEDRQTRTPMERYLMYVKDSESRGMVHMSFEEFKRKL